MPTFAYKALSAQGQSLAAELEAADRAAAVRELAARGVCVTEIRARGARVTAWLTPAGGGTLRVGPKRLAYLTRQLAVSLAAGLPLMSALEVMGQELEHAPSRELLRRLGERVQQGASLSDALAEHPRIFFPMYVRLVRVGETGGVLESVLEQLADMLERQVALTERVKSASIYPAILLLVGLASVAIIVTVIVPQIIGAVGAETLVLPWPTRVLMGLSDFVGAHGLWVALALVAAVVGWRQYVLRGPGRPWWDRMKLRIPLVGRLTRQAEAARFARSLGVLARGGVAITEALAVVRDTLQNTVLRDAIHKLAESIKAGDSIARQLQRCGLFPPLLVQMARVGESTGRLDEMLLRSAEVHEAETRVALDRLVSVLPVLMILGLAVVIGFIVAGLVLALVEFQTTGVGMLGA